MDNAGGSTITSELALAGRRCRPPRWSPSWRAGTSCAPTAIESVCLSPAGRPALAQEHVSLLRSDPPRVRADRHVARPAASAARPAPHLSVNTLLGSYRTATT